MQTCHVALRVKGPAFTQPRNSCVIDLQSAKSEKTRFALSQSVRFAKLDFHDLAIWRFGDLVKDHRSGVCCREITGFAFVNVIYTTFTWLCKSGKWASG